MHLSNWCGRSRGPELFFSVQLPKITTVTQLSWLRAKYWNSLCSPPFFPSSLSFLPLRLPPLISSGLQAQPGTCRCAAGGETGLLPADRPSHPQKWITLKRVDLPVSAVWLSPLLEFQDYNVSPYEVTNHIYSTAQMAKKIISKNSAATHNTFIQSVIIVKQNTVFHPSIFSSSLFLSSGLWDFRIWPKQNSSTTHFGFVTHQLRNAALNQHKTSSPVIVCSKAALLLICDTAIGWLAEPRVAVQRPLTGSHMTTRHLLKWQKKIKCTTV